MSYLKKVMHFFQSWKKFTNPRTMHDWSWTLCISCSIIKHGTYPFGHPLIDYQGDDRLGTREKCWKRGKLDFLPYFDMTFNHWTPTHVGSHLGWLNTLFTLRFTYFASLEPREKRLREIMEVLELREEDSPIIR